MKDVNGIGMAEYSVARANGLIEGRISPLTDALYSAGAAPLSSCEGHLVYRSWLQRFLPFLFPLVPFRPFVMFSASEQYAKAFQHRLNLRSDNTYCWMIKGHFHPNDYELVWTVEPFDVRLNREEVDLQLVQADIQILASIAGQAAEDCKASSKPISRDNANG